MASASHVIDQALRLTNRVDAKYRERALDALNRALVYYGERLPWPSLRARETYIANGTEYFTFPARVRQIVAIGDKTNKCYVAPGTQFERQYPEWELGTKPEGTPYKWRPAGSRPVIQDPAAPTKLELYTTASDSQSVYVRGIAQDSSASGTSLEFFETSEVVAAGESPTASANVYSRVFAVEAETLDKDNDIIVRYQTGNLPAARIPKNSRQQAYQRIQWLGLPAQGVEFVVHYYQDPPELGSESDPIDPQIPTDFLTWRIAGDLHWIGGQADAATAAWGNAEQLLQTKVQAETAHGQRLEQAVPFAPMIYPDDFEIYE